MNCPQCGTQVQPGQRRCACGQYLPRTSPQTDTPSEFYSRMENQVERSAKDNFRRGLLMGLGFLALFLLLEAAAETTLLGSAMLIGLTYVSVLGLTGTNIYLSVKDRKTQRNTSKLTAEIVVLATLAAITLLTLNTLI